jgi:hypothetical protein
VHFNNFRTKVLHFDKIFSICVYLDKRHRRRLIVYVLYTVSILVVTLVCHQLSTKSKRYITVKRLLVHENTNDRLILHKLHIIYTEIKESFSSVVLKQQHHYQMLLLWYGRIGVHHSI